MGEQKTLQPHQQRVVDERNELNEKVTKLNDFVGHSPIFETLHADEQNDLRNQLDVMFQYQELLDSRISRF